MCLILFAYRSHPRYPLVVAANRDEFYDRPTLPAAFWTEVPGLLAGKDIVYGGTWMGITSRGRFAAVTNFREMNKGSGHQSRGLMVRDFLAGHEEAAGYASMVMSKGNSFGGFNLLLQDAGGLRYCSNRSTASGPVSTGVHGLSNGLLDAPWPKVVTGVGRLGDLFRRRGTIDPEALFEILSDRTLAPEEELPETGFGLRWELILSPAFIVSPTYGTRSSTVILVHDSGRVDFIERSYGYPDDGGSQVRYRYELEDIASPD